MAMTKGDKKAGAEALQATSNAQEAVSPRNLQLKRSLAGMDYESGAAALSPVQMAGGRDAKSTGAWSLAELGTEGMGGDAQKANAGGEQKGAVPIGPSVEQIVQDAFTLGGRSRYQVTPHEAITWVEDMMRNARPEHKHAFQQAIYKINKRL